MKYVDILDPFNLISSDSTSKIRHLKYAKLLEASTKSKLSLRILDSNFFKIDWKESLPSKVFFYVKYVFCLKNHLSTNFRHLHLIICGDPWIPYWIYVLATGISGMKVPLQIQLHGDFGDAGWRKASIKNRLKYKLIFLRNRQIKSIRFVSYPQLNNLKRKLPNENKFFVAAVPLSFSKLPKHRPNSNGNKLKICFIGRLENERGLNTLINFHASLLETDLIFELNIVGNGSKENLLVKKLKLSSKKRKVIFHGFLETKKLVNIFTSSNISLMLAPSESYGRAARESLLCSTPILAIKSAGLIQLYDEVGGNGITWLTDPKNPVLVEKELLAATRKRVSRNTKMHLIKNSNRDLNLLINSWISV